MNKAFEALFVWLIQQSPPIVDGFIGGLIAAVLVEFVHARWRISRRKSENGK